MGDGDVIVNRKRIIFTRFLSGWTIPHSDTAHNSHQSTMRLVQQRLYFNILNPFPSWDWRNFKNNVQASNYTETSNQAACKQQHR